MATAAGGGEIMSAEELKPLLLLAKRQPVTCVIGMTRDKQGVLLLDRRMKGRKLLSVARAKARAAGVDLDTASLRFGRAEVAAASDSTTVHFTVNKAAPATLRPKLLVLLRQVHFQHCEISVDAALENEAEEDGPEVSAQGARAGGAQPNGAQAGAAPPVGTDEAGPAMAGAGESRERGAASGPGAGREGADEPNAPAAPGAPPTLSPGRRLADLAPRVAAAIAADPAGAGALQTAASVARTALASGDQAGMGRAMDQMEHLLGASPAGAGAAAGDAGGVRGESSGSMVAPPAARPGPVAGDAAPDGRPGGAAAANPGRARRGPGDPVFDKGCHTWIAVRAKVRSDLDALLKEITSYLGGNSEVVKAVHERVEPIMHQLDDSLASKLGELARNKDAAAHGTLVQEAQAILQRYEAYVAGEASLAQLELNPFHPMTVQKTLNSALVALSRVVQAA